MASYACSFFFLFGHSDTLLFWCSGHILSISEKPTFCDENTDFSQKWLLKNKPYDDVSLIPGYCFWLVEANFPCVTTNQSYFLDLSSGAPSVRMVFLRSLLRRLFAGKVELNSLNVGCFLTLEQPNMHCTLNARSRRKQLVLFSRESLSYPRRSILIYSYTFTSTATNNFNSWSDSMSS